MFRDLCIFQGTILTMLMNLSKYYQQRVIFPDFGDVSPCSRARLLV